MTKLSHLSRELIQVGLLAIIVAIFDKLQEETVKVSFNIYTLILVVVVFVDEHEIRVDFITATSANHDAHLVILTRAEVFLCHRAVLNKLRSAELTACHFDTKLNQCEFPRVPLLRLLILRAQESDLTSGDFFEDDGSALIADLLDGYNFKASI